MYDGEPHSAARLTWIAAAFVAAVSASAAHIGGDARWLAAMGEAIVHARAIPHDVVYAAVPSAAWHDAPALGQVVFHALEAAFGDKGLVLAQVAAVSAALAALTLDMRRAGAHDGAAALAVIGVVVAAPGAFLVARAELFSLALFPLLVLLLRQEAQFHTSRIWLVVPLLALWANLHGGVLVGFGTLAAYLVLHRARRAPVEAICVLAAGALALLATPALLGSIHYYSGVLHGEAASEQYGLWAPLSLHDPLDLVFLAVAIPFLAAALRSRPALWEGALFAAFAAMSIEAHRNGLWLVLFAAVPAARAFGASGSPLLPRRIALACCLVPALLAVSGLSRPVAADGAGTSLLRRAAALADGTPILGDALDAEHVALLGGRIWIGNPLDAFPRAQQRLYLEWLRGEPAGDVILRRPVRVVVVRRGSEPQRRLARNQRFREVARDARAVVYAARI
jgi:hypothetical protein